MAKRARQAASPPADDIDDQGLNGADAMASKVWKAWKDSRAHLSKWLEEARESYDFAAGVQWTEDEIKTLQDQRRPPITFNRTGVVLDAISGYEINGRQDVTYLPREAGDTGPVQIETEGAKYFRQQCDAEDEESDAFYDLICCGIGVGEHRMDFDEDPEGMLKVERVDPLEMGWDPAAMKRNLADRRWDIRGKWWDRDTAKATFPDHDFAAGGPRGDDDGLGEAQPIDREAAARYEDNGAGEQYQRRKDQVFILEYTWFESEPFASAINPSTGRMEDIDLETLKAVNDRLASVGQPPLRSVKRTRRVFKRVFVHGRDTLTPEDEREAPCPEMFHYQFMTGKRDRNKNIWFGVVRAMKDPQRWANKWLSQTMHIMNANAKGGILHEPGAFQDVAEVERRIAQPGYRLEVNEGYIDKVKIQPPLPIPETTYRLTEFAISSVRDTSGVNVELLGMADRDQPGVLEHARKQSAMAILAPFFDAQRRYRKNAGRLTLYFITTYLSDGRLIRIVDQGAKKYVPLTKKDEFAKYDVIVDESPTSPNAKEATFAALSQILPLALKQGIPVPPDLIDYVPGLPAQLAERWKAMLSAGNPKADKAAQLEDAKKVADIHKTSADAMLSEAKAGSEHVGQAADIVATLSQILQGVQMLQQGGLPPPAPSPAMPSATPPGGSPPMPMAPPPEMPPPTPSIDPNMVTQ